MKKKLTCLAGVLLTLLFLFLIPLPSSKVLSAEPLPTQVSQQEETEQIRQAVLAAVAENSRYIQGKLVASLQVTDIKISADKMWSTAWVVYYDVQIEAQIPTEPALAVTLFVNDHWQVYLPSDEGWQNALYAMPEDLLTKSEKDMWAAMNQGEVENLPTQSGYYLPWHGGNLASLSRSVGHDADFSTAHYAFDFYVGGTTICPGGGQKSAGVDGLNFNLHASRAGRVWGWDDSVENCDHSAVNFIVLQNIDDPTIFQLYMHLAQDSIPAALKTVGAEVARGQFIGVADNTGISTGSHLHFQIEHQPYWPTDNPYWAKALDMTFDDVNINGGRPRVSPLDPPYCTDDDICDVFQQTYMSNNYFQGDSTPPIGDLSGISNGQVVLSPTLNISGWGSDAQSGLDYGQLKAYFGGTWHNLGPQFNPNFNYSWNLCDPNLEVDNGVVSVAMILYDIAGNTAPFVGLRNIIKNYTCPSPPPACIPGNDQVTLFEDPYYKGGCVKFNPGNYPTGSSLSPLGNDDAESIMVGSNAIATLYSAENYRGHSQSFTQNVGFLQYQWVYSNILSSMIVSPEGNQPLPTTLVSPANAAIFRENDVIPFSWQNGGGATEYRVEIYQNSTLIRSLYWLPDPIVYVDSLAQGTYSWRVQGHNSAGEGSWSSFYTFVIQSPIIYPQAESVPYIDDMESTQSKWVLNLNSIWRYVDDVNKAHSGTRSWWYQNQYGTYDNSQPNSGSLTSPPISITSAGYYLRFYYRYQTETQGTNWDERWVQISVDAGPFQNLVQIYDDPKMEETSSWLVSKAINLSPYAGHIIRIRFLFTTFDKEGNNFNGWGIDDFSITTTPPQTCSDDRQDDTPANAFLISYDPTIEIPSAICPNGDYDFYKFYGQAGDRIVADIDAMVDGSLLDSYIFLLGSDGKTILAENDDEIYAQRRDPLLSYTLEKTDVYFLKLRAWKHPQLGGDNYFYTIRLYEDHNNPTASITWPPSGTYIPDSTMNITVNAHDVANGINRVEFFWHSTDWAYGEWEPIGTDWNAADGLSTSFDPVGQPEGNNAVLFIKAYDMAGNWTSAVAWNVGVDKTPPSTQLMPLGSTQLSNAFLLEWTSSDNLSGIDYVEVQQKMNNNAWTTLPLIDETFSNHWIIGTPGNSYSYRMHGIDHSGNTEDYPANPETSTSVPAASVLCYALDIYDTSGNDNSAPNASTIYANGASQTHNFCNPLSTDYQNDVDWSKLSVTAGEHYLILSTPTSPQTATIISLYAQDGTTLIKEFVPQSFGIRSSLAWTADQNGIVYIRLRHQNGSVIGKDVGSTLAVHTGNWTLLPIIRR